MPSGGGGLDALSVETVARFVEDHAPESGTLDFKETLVLDKMETKRDLVRDVSAFANASGGWIIVGISEQGRPHYAASWAHLSTEDAEKIRQQVIDLCASHIDPAIPGLDVQTEAVRETSLVVISIPAAGRIPHAVIGFDGKTEYHVRVNDTKKQMTPSELQAAFARASSQRVTPEPKDDSSNGRFAVEEALREAQEQAGDAPFFCIAGAPVDLHPDVLDLQSQSVRQILAENADGHTVETTLGWVISKAKPEYRGIAASIGPYAFSLRDDGLMTWTVQLSEDAGFFQSKKESRTRVFSPFAVVGYPLSFARLFCALRGIMMGTSGPYAIQMAYGGCQDILLYARCIGLPGYRPTPLPEESDKGRMNERRLKLPYEPMEFNALLPADWIARDLLKHFYQAFGYPQEDIPFWDDTVKVFNLDPKQHRQP
jgi:hypothetical protein